MSFLSLFWGQFHGGSTNESSNVNDAMALQQDTAFQRLDTDLRHFITEIAEGHTDLAHLIQNQTEEIKEHVLDQHRETRNVISYKFEEQETKAISGTACQSFLESFWFHNINQRKSDVKASHPETYNWMFRGSNAAFEDQKFEYQPQDLGDSFEAWLGSQEPCYWISGKPGSGKSTLIKFLIDHPSTAHRYPTRIESRS